MYFSAFCCLLSGLEASSGLNEVWPLSSCLLSCRRKISCNGFESLWAPTRGGTTRKPCIWGIISSYMQMRQQGADNSDTVPSFSAHVHAPLSPQTSLLKHKFKNKIIKTFRMMTADLKPNVEPFRTWESVPNCVVPISMKTVPPTFTRRVPHGVPVKISFEKEFYIIFKIINLPGMGW